jgi:hypothetical protein
VKTATPVSKRELVRLLVIEHGQKTAAELSGEPYEKVRKWTQRGKWLQSQSVPNGVSATVARISDELADNERETRLSLSRYARRAAQDAEKASLRDAPYVKAAAQVAGITHKWNDNSTQANHFTLNTLNINCLEVGSEE